MTNAVDYRKTSIFIGSVISHLVLLFYDHRYSQERVEEDLWIRDQTKQQVSVIRERLEQTRRLRKQLYDEVVLGNAMEDIRHILADEKVSPEAIKRLAEWKTGL